MKCECKHCDAQATRKLTMTLAMQTSLQMPFTQNPSHYGIRFVSARELCQTHAEEYKAGLETDEDWEKAKQQYWTAQAKHGSAVLRTEIR